MMDRPELSLVLPVYNEDGILRSNVQKLKSLLGKLNVSYEMIICDDHSTDGTRREALCLSEEDSRIVYLRFDRRIGKGGTIKNAVKVARGRALMLMDMDVPVSHQDLRRILGQMERGAKLAIAVRRSRPTMSVVRIMLSIGYNALVRLLFRTGIRDHQCGLKVLEMDFARRILPKIRCDGFLFDTELIVRARRMRIPVENASVDWVENRPRGASKIIPSRVALTLVADLAILRINQILGKELLTYNKVSEGEFTNYKSHKTHEVIESRINIRNQKLLEALRKIYLTVAFGNRI